MINIYLTHNTEKLYMQVLKKCLEESLMEYELKGLNELVLKGQPDVAKIEALKAKLEESGIYFIEDSRSELVQRIKDTISEMIFLEDTVKPKKNSTYLTEKLNYSYPYLSKIFSEYTHYSIEQFIILKKIDYAKKLLIQNKSLTEIAHSLGYSSVAHLSQQFKKTTGLTPTAFHDIIKKRKNSSYPT